MRTSCWCGDQDRIAAGISIFWARRSLRIICVISEPTNARFVPEMRSSKRTDLDAKSKRSTSHCSKQVATSLRLVESFVWTWPRSSANSLSVISGDSEKLELVYQPGSPDDSPANLEASRVDEMRVRTTVIGPHRDDIEILLEGRAGRGVCVRRSTAISGPGDETWTGPQT